MNQVPSWSLASHTVLYRLLWCKDPSHRPSITGEDLWEGIQIFASYKDTSNLGLELTLMTSVSSITSVKTVYPNMVTFWGTGVQYMKFVRDLIQPITSADPPEHICRIPNGQIHEDGVLSLLCLTSLSVLAYNYYRCKGNLNTWCASSLFSFQVYLNYSCLFKISY